MGKNSAYNSLMSKEETAGVGGPRIKTNSDAGVADEGSDVTEKAAAEWVAGDQSQEYVFRFDPNKKRFTFTDATGKAIDRLSLLATFDQRYVAEHYGFEEDHGYDSFGNIHMSYDSSGQPTGPKAVGETVKQSRKIMRVIQFLQDRFNQKSEGLSQDAREASFSLENARWEDQKSLASLKSALVTLQGKFNEMQKTYDEREDGLLKKRYAALMERAKIDLVTAESMLDYKEYVLAQYREQTPVSYVTGEDGIAYGFNSSGRMIAIWDAYGNHVSVVYESVKTTDDNGNVTWDCGGKLTGVIDADGRETSFGYVDGMLNAITDAMDRRTGFAYDKDGRLTTIVYPNGDVSVFTYADDQLRGDLLRDIVPPAGIGVRVEYDAQRRPVRVSGVTTVRRIDSDGIEKDDVKIRDTIDIGYNLSGTSASVSDRKGHKATYLFNSAKEWVTEYRETDGVIKSIRTYDVSRGRCRFSMQQTRFDRNMMGSATLLPHDAASVVSNGSGGVTINSTSAPAKRYAEWQVDVASIPEHATDLILSGSASAVSAETADRRTTEYCGRFGHEHLLNDPSMPESVRNRRFEIRAEVAYAGKVKTFVASYDWMVNTKQFAAIPVTFDEDRNGRPIRPISIKITADYSNNQGVCDFSEISLADGDWTYADVDVRGLKTFECGSRRITDKTVDGVNKGKFTTYAETFFTYDRKGNLIREETTTEKDGVEKEYVTTHEYNKQSRPIRTTSPDGMVSENVYDRNGNVIRSVSYHRSNPASKFVQEAERDEKGKITSELDERGNRTALRYAEGTNIVTGSVAPDGQEFALGLDPHTDELMAISSSVHGEPNSTQFVYTKGMLTRLSSGGTDYDYAYDGWGRRAAVSIAGAPYVTSEFRTDGDRNETVVSEYANGEMYETVTDRSGKLMAVRRISGGAASPYITNEYDGEDRLIRVTDHLAETVSEYVYNEDGSLVKESGGGVEAVVDRNADGDVEAVRYVIEGFADRTYRNEYDDLGRISRITLPDGSEETVEYDGFGRIRGIKHPSYSERIHYYQEGGRATNLVATMHIGDERIRYVYDVRGNVSEIRLNGRIASRYSYDGLDRLIREDNVRLGKSWTFDHDSNGNVLSKNVYDLTFGDLLHGQEFPYVYENDGNRDRMSSYNGETCVYDELGNPTTYRNKRLKWGNLRDLVRYDDVTFSYDASGRRTGKRRGGTSTRFWWASGMLLAERRTSTSGDLELGDHLYSAQNDSDKAYCNANVVEISYIRGSDGLAGFVISKDSDECTYHYRKNMQGDVTHITDVNGNVKAEYVYDAWGNHKIIRNDDNIGTINPFRYRGYYYDEETGLYYLRTRYYDPETGRFVNADAIGILDETQGEINGLNLYAYCGGNPVMRVDPSGQGFWSFLDPVVNAVKSIGSSFDNMVAATAIAFNIVAKMTSNWIVNHWKEILIGAAFIAAGIAITVLTAGTGVGLVATLGSALFSSMTQVGLSMAISVAVDGIISVASGGGFFDNIGDSLANGFMWGGVFAGGAQILSGALRTTRLLSKDFNGYDLGKVRLLVTEFHYKFKFWRYAY